MAKEKEQAGVQPPAAEIQNGGAQPQPEAAVKPAPARPLQAPQPVSGKAGGDNPTNGNNAPVASPAGEAVNSESAQAGGEVAKPAWVDALEARVAAVEKGWAAFEAARQEEARRAQVERITEGLPDSLRAVYERMNYSGTREEWEGTLKAIHGEVEAVRADLKRQGVSFAPPRGGDGSQGAPKEASDAELAAALERAGLRPVEKK